MADAKAVGYLELSIKGFEDAISAAKKALAGLAAAFGAFKTAEFFKDGIRDAINFGNEMYNASRKLGNFDPGQLLLTQKALEQSGRSVAEARAEIDEFISSGRNIADIFHGTKGYADALKQVTAQYGSQAKVLSENADKFAKVFLILQSIGDKMKTFFLAMTGEFLKPLQALLETLDKIDLASVGQQFGKYIADALNVLVGAIANGTLWEIVKTGLIIAAKEFQNYMEGVVNFVGESLADILSTVIAGVFNLIARLIKEINWGSIAAYIIGALAKVGAFLVKLFLDAGALLAATIVTALAKVGIGDGKKDFMSNFQDMKNNQEGVRNAVDVGKQFGQFIQDSTAEDAKNATIQAAKITADEIKKTIANINVKFQKGEGQDASGDIARLTQLLKTAKELGESTIGKTILPNDVRDTKADPLRVIGDSLAKVGGGGGYLRSGQTILEKEAMKQTKAQQAMEKQLETIARNTSKNTGEPSLAY